MWAAWIVLVPLPLSSVTRNVTGVPLASLPADTRLVSFGLEMPGSTIRTVAFSPDGRFLAAGHVKTSRGENKYEFSAGIGIYDLVSRKWLVNRVVDSGTLQYSSSKHRTIEPKFLNYTSDGKRLTVFQGGFVRILDAASLTEQSHIDLDDLPLYAMGNKQAHVWDMKVSSTENKVAVLVGGFPTDTSGLLRVYDLTNSRMTFEWKVPDYLGGASMTFSPDGNKIAVVEPERDEDWRTSEGPDVAIFEFNTESVKLRLNTGPDATSTAVFLDDDHLLTVPMWHAQHMKVGSIKFWDINTGKLTREISDPAAGIHDYVDVSKNGKILMAYIGLNENSGHFMKSVTQRFRIWELPSGKVVADSPEILPLTVDRPRFRLSPDGKTIVALWPEPSAYKVHPQVFQLLSSQASIESGTKNSVYGQTVSSVSLESPIQVVFPSNLPSPSEHPE
jgi:WD40 repeat protein